MASVRTFYWDPVLSQRTRVPRRTRVWRTGNAGDLLNRDFISQLYGLGASNADDGSGRRLLLVGSVAHRIEKGDLVCGVGTKGKPIPPPSEVHCTVLATRGPITTEAFSAAGHDLSAMRFEFDPGLLIRLLSPVVPAPQRGEVIFIPHYRDAARRMRVRRGVRTVDVDTSPVELAQRIATAEFVYTSSLHGLIFAHALGRPVTLVAPQTPEPMIKYQDYFSSIGLPWKQLPSIDEAVRAAKPLSPISLPPELANVVLPDFAEVRRHNLVNED